jgi:hypothetical protein
MGHNNGACNQNWKLHKTPYFLPDMKISNNKRGASWSAPGFSFIYISSGKRRVHSDWITCPYSERQRTPHTSSLEGCKGKNTCLYSDRQRTSHTTRSEGCKGRNTCLYSDRQRTSHTSSLEGYKGRNTCTYSERHRTSHTSSLEGCIEKNRVKQFFYYCTCIRCRAVA